MTKKSLNLTLHPQIIKWAEQIAQKRHYSSVSVLIEELIRERHDEIFQVKTAASPQHPPLDQIVTEEDLAQLKAEFAQAKAELQPRHSHANISDKPTAS